MWLGHSKHARPQVFFCTCGSRNGLAEKMLDHWKGLDVDLKVLTPKLLGCDALSFQKLRRAAAEVMARDSFYVVTDDDCELITPLELGLEAIKSHDEFGMISAFPSNCNISRWTPEDYEPFEDMSVTEVHSVGGIRIIRRGSMLKGWPEQDGRGYDREHCQAMRNSGFRTGYSQFLRMIHHGEGLGLSTVWRTNVLTANPT